MSNQSTWISIKILKHMKIHMSEVLTCTTRYDTKLDLRKSAKYGSTDPNFEILPEIWHSRFKIPSSLFLFCKSLEFPD